MRRFARWARSRSLEAGSYLFPVEHEDAKRRTAAVVIDAKDAGKTQPVERFFQLGRLEAQVAVAESIQHPALLVRHQLEDNQPAAGFVDAKRLAEYRARLLHVGKALWVLHASELDIGRAGGGNSTTASVTRGR